MPDEKKEPKKVEVKDLEVDAEQIKAGAEGGKGGGGEEGMSAGERHLSELSQAVRAVAE